MYAAYPPLTTTRAASNAHGAKFLVGGGAGVGKTVLCSTAPFPIILSAEAGLLSLAWTDIPVWVIRKWSDLIEAYRFLTQSAERVNYHTTCLDSLSEIAETVLDAEKKNNRDPRKAYGKMFDDIIPMVKGFRDMPNMHVYFSTKVTAVKDELSGLTKYGPMMPGKQLGPALPYLFDEVFSLEVGRTPEGQSYRYIRTQADPQYEVKDRSGRLDPFEPADLGHIIKKIYGR